MSKPFGVLVPGIEKRLDAWTEMQKRLHEEPRVKVRPTVTLSRAFGCEGYAIADRVRGLLSESSGEPWNVYDKALLEEVMKDEGVSMRLLKNLGVTASSFERLGMWPKDYYQQVMAFDALGQHIVHIAGVGNAVIVGRGGAVLCRGLRNCFHFRVDARFDWRVESIARRLEMPRSEAEAFVRANGTLRDEFVSGQLKANLSDPALFDAVFNNERHGVPEIAAAIAAYVREAWPRVVAAQPVREAMRAG